MRASRISLLAAALAAVLVGCGGDDDGDSGPSTGQLIETPTVVATVPRATLGAGARCDVRVVSINYNTPGARPGELSNSSGGVLVPTGTDPACQGPFPLLAYTRGTAVIKGNSMSDPANGELQGLMSAFASGGYMVVATDYLGYAKSQYPFHPYLHSDSEASAAIDSIRAARAWASTNNVPLSGKVMVYGYSQGGHSSLSTQRAIETRAAGEFNLAAAGHGASPAALSTALRTGQEILGGQFFIPFLITAWQKVYGDVYANPSEIFTPQFAPTIENLLPAADPAALGVLPAGPAYNAALFQPSFITGLQNGNTTTNGVLRAALRNDLVASGWNPTSPTRFCAGSQDPTVIWQTSTQAAINRWGNLPNVSSRDVDREVQQAGQAQFAALTPQQQAAAGGQTNFILARYHGALAPVVCLQDMRVFFDARR